jgi:hypothetical protein
MEMTFPHHALRQDSVGGPKDYRTLLAVVIARQANSRTVHALRQAESASSSTSDAVDQRMHYFSGQDGQKVTVRGAFLRGAAAKPNTELDVYQAGSRNIKVQPLENQSTGEQLNHAGHGASRKL